MKLNLLRYYKHILKALEYFLSITVKHSNSDYVMFGITRDVQCISCDKNVVMKMEDANRLKMEPLPCTMSMKPYLTYELDRS